MLNISKIKVDNHIRKPSFGKYSAQVLLQSKKAFPRIDLMGNSGNFLAAVYKAGGSIIQSADDTLTIIGSKTKEHDYLQALFDFIFRGKH